MKKDDRRDDNGYSGVFWLMLLLGLVGVAGLVVVALGAGGGL